MSSRFPSRKSCDGARSRQLRMCLHLDADNQTSAIEARFCWLSLAVGLLQRKEVVPARPRRGDLANSESKGDQDGQQLCVSLRSDVVQVRGAGRRKGTIKGR